MPSNTITRSLYHIASKNAGYGADTRADVSSSMYALLPVVKSRCFLSPNLTQENIVSGRLSEEKDTPILYWAEDGASLQIIGNKSKILRDAVVVKAPSRWFFEVDFATVWYDVPGADSHSVLAIFSDYWNQEGQIFTRTSPLKYKPEEVLITACIVSAYWMWSLHRWTLENGIPTVSTDLSLEDIKDDESLSIKLSVDTIRGLNTSVFAAGTCTRTTALPVVLAMALSNIRICDRPELEVNYQDTLTPNPIITDRYVSYSSDSGYNMENGSMSIFYGTWTAFPAQVFSTGYGYGSISTTVILSLVILSLYCLTTLIYLSILIVTRKVSTAWASPLEFALLALRSRNGDFLGHTSAGVESVSTFRQPVGIRVNDSDGLELVFANDQNVNHMTFRKVEPNKEY